VVGLSMSMPRQGDARARAWPHWIEVRRVRRKVLKTGTVVLNDPLQLLVVVDGAVVQYSDRPRPRVRVQHPSVLRDGARASSDAGGGAARRRHELVGGLTVTTRATGDLRVPPFLARSPPSAIPSSPQLRSTCAFALGQQLVPTEQAAMKAACRKVFTTDVPVSHTAAHQPPIPSSDIVAKVDVGAPCIHTCAL
jgi:hypothetical protein